MNKSHSASLIQNLIGQNKGIQRTRTLAYLQWDKFRIYDDEGTAYAYCIVHSALHTMRMQYMHSIHCKNIMIK